MPEEHETDIAKNELRKAFRALRDAWRKDGQEGQFVINLIEDIAKEVIMEVIKEDWPKV